MRNAAVPNPGRDGTALVGAARSALSAIVDEADAIERYNQSCTAAQPGCFPPIRWPDLMLSRVVLARLAEGVLDARLDFPALAFGEDFDAAACAERLEEAWRLDELQPRYAPEGAFVCVAFTVRVTLTAADEDDKDTHEELAVAAELCVSFTHRHHTRPFVDFMSGEVRRASDGQTRYLDPFAVEISPEDAVVWRLDGGG